MALDDFLLEGERIVESSERLDITNYRIIQYEETYGGENFKDIHFKFLESVEYGLTSIWIFFYIAILFLIFGVLAFIVTKDLTYLLGLNLMGIIFLIFFRVFRRGHVVFKGVNSEIEASGEDREVVQLVRKLQNDYLNKEEK